MVEGSIMNKKYPYSYTIITKKGETITNRMNIGKEIKATSQSKAKKILEFYYPGCIIMHLKTKTERHFDSSNVQFGNAILLG